MAAKQKPRKGKVVDMAELGKCCIYFRHSRGFNETLRPAHDSYPDIFGWLTTEQVKELRDFVQAKMLSMTRINGGGTS